MTVSNKSKIYFFFEKETRLENRGKLKRFLSSVFKEEGRDLGSLNFIFCSDDHLRAINRDYLRHDYYTDIITFELSPKERPVEGEVYISVDRVNENARLFGVSRKKELHRVILHGVLHLCGYGDKRKTEKKEMTAKEDHYLAAYL